MVKEKVIKIQSVSDFLNKIDKKINSDSKLFYRGQPRVYPTTLPSLLRVPKYKDNEKELIEGFLTKDPNLFTNSKNNFDALALMQHHQLPTRLLDLTTNPLVALYFACEKSDDVGEIFVYSDEEHDFKVNKLKLSREDILKSPYSDQVEILASMSRLSKFDRTRVLEKGNEFVNSLSNSGRSYKKWEKFYKKEILTHSKKKSSMRKDYDKFNKDISVKRLYHEIKRDIKTFDEVIDPFTLIIPKIVTPRVIDDRIKNQRGLLLVVPFTFYKKNSRKNIQKTLDSLRVLSEHDNKKKIKFVVMGFQKQKILDELAQIGITKSFIYPDHKNIAEEVSNSVL